MSFTKITPQEASNLSDETILIAIDNGDLRALKEVMAKWNFNSEENALRFAFGVLFLSMDSKTIKVLKDGSLAQVYPTEALLKKQDPEAMTNG